MKIESHRVKSKWIGLVGASLLFAMGCAGGGHDQPDPAGICAAGHAGATEDGDPVTVCEHLFPSRPFVRPPADALDHRDAATLHVAFSNACSEIADVTAYCFVDRKGTEYVAVDGAGSPLALDHLPPGMRMPSNRNLYLIYRVQGKIGTFTDRAGKSIASLSPTSAEPEILIDGEAIDSSALGTWQGDVSARNPDGGFDVSRRVPVRVTFQSLTSPTHFREWDGSKTLADGVAYEAVGGIDNWSQPVRGSDGGCLPSLSAMGSLNPFVGAADGGLSMFRVAGMHAPGDDELVIRFPAGGENWAVSGMTGLRALSPAELLMEAPSDAWTRPTFFPHGAPLGDTLSLERAPAAGGTCP